MELGCGLGACGLACGMHGAAEVLLTDVPKMQRLLEYNIASNLPVMPETAWVHSAVLDWTAILPAGSHWRSSCCARQWDVILGSDLVYDERLFEPLWRTLDALAGPKTLIILALPKRKRSAPSNGDDSAADGGGGGGGAGGASRSRCAAAAPHASTDLEAWLSCSGGRWEWRLVERRAFEPHQSVVHVLHIMKKPQQQQQPNEPADEPAAAAAAGNAATADDAAGTGDE